MIRNLLIFSALALSAQNAFAATGDTCAPATFQGSCNQDGTIQYCDDQTNANAPVEAAIACSDPEFLGAAAADASCGTPGCVGACDEVGISCLSAIGEKCIGFSVFTNQDQADNQLFATVQCEGNATCSLTVENQVGVDRCVAHLGPECTTAGESSCTGSVWTLCFANQEGTAGFLSNVAIDCGLFDTTCGEQPCECDEQCGEDGKCTNGFCEGGVTCPLDINDPQLGDCPSAGEGEGEGEDAACESDAECARDQKCEEGACVAAETTGEDPPEACSSSGVMAPGAMLLVGLAPLFRRRRR